ncbi:hypothetical protein SADUNF_Sadunf04G0001000 [Salix dunnii]|uniref:Uncharacterized protein n=1 Tax=Salix dunnii TaxID=1413687 RepID=A0A835N3T4_9ROSI|nr:hypothetical protein SADUNF_Sadunf04G0001000 [Salix dunnii]
MKTPLWQVHLPLVVAARFSLQRRFLGNSKYGEKCLTDDIRQIWLSFSKTQTPTISSYPRDLKRLQQGHEAISCRKITATDKVLSSTAALTLLTSVLLYPKTLGVGSVFSGCVPLSSSIMEQITPDVKRLQTTDSVVAWNG